MTDVEIDGNRLRARVQGTVEPLPARLTAARVTQLLSHEPSLEEMFLARYGTQTPDGHAGQRQEEMTSGGH